MIDRVHVHPHGETPFGVVFAYGSLAVWDLGADAEFLEALGIPYRDAGGIPLPFTPLEAPFMDIKEINPAEGVRVIPGGIAILNGKRHYLVSVFYDIREGREEEHAIGMSADAAVLQSMHAALVFAQHGKYPEIILSALYPMTTIPGAWTRRGFRQSLSMRLKKTRETAKRLGGVQAGTDGRPIWHQKGERP